MIALFGLNSSARLTQKIRRHFQRDIEPMQDYMHTRYVDSLLWR
jgi:hypothetical protein